VHLNEWKWQEKIVLVDAMHDPFVQSIHMLLYQQQAKSSPHDSQHTLATFRPLDLRLGFAL